MTTTKPDSPRGERVPAEPGQQAFGGAAAGLGGAVHIALGEQARVLAGEEEVAIGLSGNFDCNRALEWRLVSLTLLV